MARICLHGFVSGRVQRVWYRGATSKEARARNVTGWAHNLPDGRVEVLLCGEEDDVRAVEAWLHRGPPAARVDHVEIEEVAWRDIVGFRTG